MKASFQEDLLVDFAKSIELIATRVLEGAHRSGHGGEGLEFNAHLPYEIGEEIRRIDWKRYAASDKLLVRRFQKQEKTAWTILLDNSKSMNYGEKKLVSARWAACMIFLAKIWGDSWKVYPDYSYSLNEAFLALLENKAGAEPSYFGDVSGLSSSQLLVISDMFFDLQMAEESLQKLSERFRNIHVVHVLDPREARFEFENVLRFEDLESSDKLTLDSGVAKSLYLKEFNSHKASIENLVKNHGVYHSVTTGDKALEAELIEFFEVLWAS